MATLGSKSIAATSHNTLKFSWTLDSQSIANNTSTVSWKMQLISDKYGAISSTASKDYKVVVNGTTYSGTNTIGIAASTTKTLKSGTTTITHASDGTKTFSYSFSQEFAITFSGSSVGTKSSSGSGTLTTIPRKSTLSASNGILGTAQTLTVNRNSSSFTHTITYKCGTASGTVCTKSSSTSISWTPPTSLASQNTSGTSVSITFTITTYNGTTSLGSNTKTITCSIPSDTAPTVSLTVTDATGNFDTYGAYIQGISKFNVQLTDAGSSGSTISSRKTTANGKTYTAKSFTTGVLTSSGTLNVNTTVTDSRGRTASASKSLTVLAYSAPKISNVSVKRCNSSGTSASNGSYLCLTFSSTVSSLNNQNTATYVLKYKKTSASSYTSVTLSSFANNYSVSNGTYIFAADTSSSYDVILEVTDAFKTVDSNGSGSSIKKLFSFLSRGLGIALGKVAELEGVFDVDFKINARQGYMPQVIPDGTNLNNLTTPNIYAGYSLGTATYYNVPFSGSYSFYLEVFEAATGALMQRLTLNSKTVRQVYERFYYDSSWGTWCRTSDFGQQLLWSGQHYMTDSHTASLYDSITNQPTGIILVWSRYSNSTVRDYNYNTFFISKKQIELIGEGKGHTFILANDPTLGVFCSKYLYIYNNKIVGNSNNNSSGTGSSGITYDNSQFVLRYVIGV